MADTWETLKTHLRAGEDDDEFIERCFDDATDLVSDYVGDKYVPASRLALAILKTGSELYSQRDAPSGISQFSDMNSNPVRVARDPLVAAKPLLRKYVIGIA